MPYQRGAGMTETQARQLLATINESLTGQVTINSEGRFFVVSVTADGETFTVRDEADWRWLRSKLNRA